MKGAGVSHESIEDHGTDGSCVARSSTRWARPGCGYGGGPNREAFKHFALFREDFRFSFNDDESALDKFRFVLRNDVPIVAFHQDLGLAWSGHRENPYDDLMEVYVTSRRNILVTTLRLLEAIDNR